MNGKIEFWRTTDGGKNWAVGSIAGLEPSAISGLYVLDEMHAWIGNRREAVYYTRDGGQTWKRSKQLPFHPNPNSRGWRIESLHFIDEMRGWACGGYGAILHTADGGETWSFQESGVLALLHDIKFKNASIGFACGSAEALLKTVNGGATWEILSLTSDSTYQASGHQAIYMFDNGKSWVISIYSYLLESYDDWVTWSRKPFGQQYHSFEMKPGGDVFVWDANYDLWVVSADTRNEKMLYQTAEFSLSFLRGVEFADENRGWIYGDFGWLLRTDDGGKSWEKMDIGTKNTIFDFDIIDRDHIWLVAGGGLVMSSKDGGETWTYADIESSKGFSSIEFASADIGFIGTQNAYYRTEDGGKSWTFIPAGGEYFSINTISFLDENFGVAQIGDNSSPWRLMQTRDGGITWTGLTDINLPTTIDHVAIRPDRTVFVVDQEKVYKINPDTKEGVLLPYIFGPQRLSASLKTSDLRFYSNEFGILAHGAGLYTTRDGGNTWEFDPWSPQEAIPRYFESERMIAVSDRGIWFYNHENSGAVAQTKLVQSESSAWQLEFPSVFGGTYMIESSHDLKSWTLGEHQYEGGPGWMKVDIQSGTQETDNVFYRVVRNE